MPRQQPKDKTKPNEESGNPAKGYGDRIKEIRKQLNVKQNEFAARVGTTAQNMSEIEKNKYKPGVEVLKRIAEEYNVNLYYLVFGTGEMFIEPNSISLINMNDGIELTHYEKDFLFLFYHSRMFRFRMLSHQEKLLMEEKDYFDAELIRLDELKKS